MDVHRWLLHTTSRCLLFTFTPVLHRFAHTLHIPHVYARVLFDGSRLPVCGSIFRYVLVNTRLTFAVVVPYFTFGYRRAFYVYTRLRLRVRFPARTVVGSLHTHVTLRSRCCPVYLHTPYVPFYTRPLLFTFVCPTRYVLYRSVCGCCLRSLTTPVCPWLPRSLYIYTVPMVILRCLVRARLHHISFRPLFTVVVTSLPAPFVLCLVTVGAFRPLRFTFLVAGYLPLQLPVTC